MNKLLCSLFVLVCVTYNFSYAQSFTENFDDINNLPVSGWSTQNNSQPTGLTNWFQGNSNVFTAFNGTGAAYIGTNFNNTTGANTISNWLISPNRTLRNGQTIRFYTRTAANSFADRLQVRLSTDGSSTDVGSTATSVGSFTTVLLDINPTLSPSGYPSVWTQYTITLSELPPLGISGRFAFRYFVTNGGPSGANSDYIGIDNVVYDAGCITTISLSPTSGTVCPGGTVSLSASQADSYLWSTGESTATILATPASTTVYSVTATTGACTSSSASAEITVNSPLTLTLSASNGGVITCSGVSITASSNAATSFTLLPGGQTNNTGLFMVSTSGTYTVVAGNGFSGCRQTGVQSITEVINPGGSSGSITASGPASTVSPARLTTTATGRNFVFTGPNGFVFSNVYRTAGTYSIMAPNITIPGTYTLLVYSAEGCPPVSSSITVN